MNVCEGKFFQITGRSEGRCGTFNQHLTDRSPGRIFMNVCEGKFFQITGRSEGRCGTFNQEVLM